MYLIAHVLDNASAGDTGLAIIAIAAMVIPFIGLGFLARYFLRAGREDEDVSTKH